MCSKPVIAFLQVKEQERDFKKKISITGGGDPPSPPKPQEEIALAASMMAIDLAMGNDVYEAYTKAPAINDSDSVLTELQKEGNLSVDIDNFHCQVRVCVLTSKEHTNFCSPTNCISYKISVS